MQKRTELDMLTDYLNGLNIMIDASSQLIHQFQNVKWIAIRDMLNIIKDSAVKEIKK